MMKKLSKQFNKITKFVIPVILLGALMFVSSCKDDNDDPDDPSNLPTENIMEIVDKTASVSTLKAAIDAAGLRATLSGDGPFTVFAPTNDAFAEVDPDVLVYLLATPAELTKVLLYHVVSGKVMSDDLSNGEVETLNDAETVTVDLSSGVMINDATVTSPNVEASNGVIHIIDKVLIPENLDLSGMTPSAAEAAIATEDLSTLVAILSLDGLSDILAAAANDDAELTVFAPTNAAFQAVLDALGFTSIDEIPESVLLDIVQYHIVGAVAKSTDLSATTYETLNGESVTVDLSDGVKVDGAKVVNPDIEVSNGVVHIIDAVLLPSFYKSALGTIVEVPLFRKEYSTLTAALVKAELVETLLGDGPFTVFAPNNAAFEAAGITSLDGLTKEDLTPILLFHVASGAAVKKADLGENIFPAAGVNSLNGTFYISKTGDDIAINGTSNVIATDIEKSNGVIHVIDRTLMPPTQTVVEIAAALATATENEEFTTLVALLTDPNQSAVLNTVSNEDGSFTIFAPTDAAFEEIASVTATLSDAQITQVLTYHVLNNRVYSTDLSDGLEATTVNGQTLNVNISDGTVTITDKDGSNSDATVIDVNVNGINGVIHVIDKVLIPTL